MKNTKSTNNIKLIFRISSFMRKDRKKYILGSILASFEIVNTLLFPFVFKEMIEIVSSSGASGSIAFMIGLLSIILLITPIICYGNYIRQYSFAKGKSNMRKDLFSHIQRLPVAVISDRKIGDYITLLSSDTVRANGILQGFGTKSLVQFLFIFPITAIILFYYHSGIAIIAIILTILVIAISAIFNPKVRTLSNESQEKMSESSNYFLELISGFTVIRVFSAYDKLLSNFCKLCREILKKRIHYRTLNGLVDSFLNFFQASAQPFTFIIGVLLIIDNKMDIGTIVLVSTIAGVMANGARGVGVFIANMQSPLVSAKRIFDVLDLKIENPRKTINNPDYSSKIAIELKNVTFGYKSPILKDLSFKISAGETVAIVGASGCGKTTIFKLLQDFYPIQSGNISFFGTEGKDLSIYDIRKMISYVPQECTIFDGTILDNILLGNLESNFEDVKVAASKAYLDDFINSLPEGYNTQVGEKGSKLSGGQRQRIAIARAFLKNSLILLLDEATSALDSESELEVMKALTNLMKGRTTLIISHRQSSMQNANRVIEIESGKVKL